MHIKITCCLFLFVLFLLIKLSFSPFYFGINQTDNCEKNICAIKEYGKICSRDMQRNELYGFYGYVFVKTNVMPINSKDEFGILFYPNFNGKVCVELYGPEGLMLKEYYALAKGKYRYFIFKPADLEKIGKYTLRIVDGKLPERERVLDKLEFELIAQKKSS